MRVTVTFPAQSGVLDTFGRSFGLIETKVNWDEFQLYYICKECGALYRDTPDDFFCKRCGCEILDFDINLPTEKLARVLGRVIERRVTPFKWYDPFTWGKIKNTQQVFQVREGDEIVEIVNPWNTKILIKNLIEYANKKEK
jgi:hypothetical protein